MTKVYLECGTKKVFAGSLDWPGWGRFGKDEDAALAALADYAQRYAEVAGQTDARWPKNVARSLEVVERVAGNATTEFGAPAIVLDADREPLTKARADRLTDLLEASWAVLDRIAATSPEELRKGPRGGGRDRDKMLDHVIGAEAAYARQIGVRHKQPAFDDAEAIAAMREGIASVLRKRSDGAPLRPNGWPARYAVRRMAWHVLDHAWEMQDRAE
jgi:hypothetical protein